MSLWNLDTVIEYISKNGAEVGEDNDGQIVIYTNLHENATGDLVPFPDDYDSNVVSFSEYVAQKMNGELDGAA